MDGTSKAQTSKKSTRFSDILKQKKPLTNEEPDDKIVQEESSTPQIKAILPIVDTPNESDVSISPKQRKKRAKRGNPDYTQSLFWLLHKTSKQLDRELLNLSDAGQTLDRSELVEQLLNVFYSLSEKVGTDEALLQLQKLKDSTIQIVK